MQGRRGAAVMQLCAPPPPTRSRRPARSLSLPASRVSSALLVFCDVAVDATRRPEMEGGPSALRGRRDGGGDAVECTAAAVSSPPFRFGRSSLPRAARHTGSSLRWRFFFPASEGAPRSSDVAASAAGWVQSLAASPRRRRPKRRFQPAMAPVAPDESVDLFIGLSGGLGCSAVGWFRGRAERRSVFLLGTANPMVVCACTSSSSSSHFDFFLAAWLWWQRFWIQIYFAIRSKSKIFFCSATGDVVGGYMEG